MPLRVYWYAFQWNCFNLVYTCNIGLILFLKCDVTKFRNLPLSHNVTLRRPRSPLTCDVIYGWPLLRIKASCLKPRDRNIRIISIHDEHPQMLYQECAVISISQNDASTGIELIHSSTNANRFIRIARREYGYEDSQEEIGKRREVPYGK